MNFSIGDHVIPCICHFPINAESFYAGITKDMRHFERIRLQMEVVDTYSSTDTNPELIMVKHKSNLYAPMPAAWFKFADDNSPIGPY